MGAASAVIHCNRSLIHQVELAQCLKAGVPGATISYSPDTPADLHIVLGPWFALQQWRFAHTLYIDRAYWGDPDCVSVHWLDGGEKVRTTGHPYRPHPHTKPWKTGGKTIVLCDYGMDGRKLAQLYGGAIRRHPAEGETGALGDVLAGYSVAVGRRTTALVDAAIAGLKVVTSDPNSPVWPISGRRCDREQWLTDLAWHNWSKDEITRGDMWTAIHSVR